MTSGNVLKRMNIGGEIVTKKLEIAALALINTVVAFNASAEPLNLPKEYSENITVKGQEKDVFDYDFNSDGINEKVVVTYNVVDNLIGAVVSIYTNQGGKEILTYQIAFDKKFKSRPIKAIIIINSQIYKTYIRMIYKNKNIYCFNKVL